jgi:hypothetical protein
MGMLRLLAAILLIGGPILRLVFRSWGLGGLVFGLGAMVLGFARSGSERIAANALIGIGLLLGGAFTAIEGLIRLLS